MQFAFRARAALWVLGSLVASIVACAPSDAGPREDEPSDPASLDLGIFRSLAPTPPPSFQEAKVLALELYRDHKETLYCGCAFDEHKAVLPDACGYSPREDDSRARRIEWEHVVPAAAFGHQRACWMMSSCVDATGTTLTPRECCAATDPEFRAMEAELQNLVPEIGELNEERSNRSYGLIAGEARAYGRCDFEVDVEADIVEPREEIRGDVARIYLYMFGVYGSVALPLEEEAVEQFWAWHQADPPDAWERERNQRIGELQGEINPLISPP